MPTGTSILVDHCLLQAVEGGYRLHDLVLEYLQLIIKMDPPLAKAASSRQAQYLGRLDVLLEYKAGEFSAGGVYSLVALWNSVKSLDGGVDVGGYYTRSLHGATEVEPWFQAGRLLHLLVR